MTKQVLSTFLAFVFGCADTLTPEGDHYYYVVTSIDRSSSGASGVSDNTNDALRRGDFIWLFDIQALDPGGVNARAGMRFHLGNASTIAPCNGDVCGLHFNRDAVFGVDDHNPPFSGGGVGPYSFGPDTSGFELTYSYLTGTAFRADILFHDLVMEFDSEHVTSGTLVTQAASLSGAGSQSAAASLNEIAGRICGGVRMMGGVCTCPAAQGFNNTLQSAGDDCHFSPAEAETVLQRFGDATFTFQATRVAGIVER